MKTPHLGRPGQPFFSDLLVKDYIPVPRSVIYAGRYLGPSHPLSDPRHRMLILALAARQHGDRPAQVYWESLAKDLGVSHSTVRKWARSLRAAGLLTIQQRKGVQRSPNDRPGYRNAANKFDLTALNNFLLKEILPKREAERRKRPVPISPSEAKS